MSETKCDVCQTNVTCVWLEYNISVTCDMRLVTCDLTDMRLA